MPDSRHSARAVAQSSKNVKGYCYPTLEPWKKGRKNSTGLSFHVSPQKNCVLFINTTNSTASTRYFPTVQSFINMRNQLKNAIDSVEFWDDMDIPKGAFSIPVSVVCNMGSLRFYLRTGAEKTRLSKHHCQQLLWMFDNALEDLDRWEAGMRTIFGDDLSTMPRE